MKIKFFANIAELTKTKELIIDGVPNDVFMLLLLLCDMFGDKLRKKLISSDGKEIHHEIIVLINGRHIEHLSGKDTILKQGDDVRIFPVLGGG